METVLAGIVGAGAGVLAALPLLGVLRAARPSVPFGLAAVIASFTLLTAAIMFVRLVIPGLLLSLAIPAVLSFLVVTVAHILRMKS